jgi:hypothetical protein
VDKCHSYPHDTRHSAQAFPGNPCYDSAIFHQIYPKLTALIFFVQAGVQRKDDENAIGAEFYHGK